MTVTSPRVALISAVPAAIPPTQSAFDELFPEAAVWNILDDRLLDDAANGVTAPLAARLRRLIDHTIIEGADAVLVTCSMYAAITRQIAASTSIPLQGSDDALFAAIADGGYRRITLVSPAAEPLLDTLTRIRPIIGTHVEVTGAVAEGAPTAARSGDIAALVESVATAITPGSRATEAIVLGQYSLAPAGPGVEAATGLPTLTAPGLAVQGLRTLLCGRAS